MADTIIPDQPLPSAAPFASNDVLHVQDMPRPVAGASPTLLRSLEATRAFESQMAHDDAVAELLADLDFETVPYQIDLIRKEPEYHPDGTHIGLGWVHTYTEPIQQKQIADRFGGGKYQLSVRVPTAPGSQKYKFYDSKIILIAGEPVIPPSRVKKAADTGTATEAVREIMAKQLQIMEAQIRETKAEAKEMVATMQQTNNPSMMLEMMREERKMQEQRLQAEREERTREREDERRRQEAQMERARQEHEKQLEMLRIEAKERADIALRQAEQARLDAAKLAVDQPKQMETMLMFMQRMDAEKQANAQKANEFMMTMMQQSSQSQAQQMQATQQMQLSLMTEALKDAKSNKNGLLEMATQVKALKGLGLFGGSGDDAGPAPGMSWQELAKEGLSKLPDIINAVRPNPGATAATATAPKQPAPKQVGPGAAAVLENPPTRKPKRMTDGGVAGAPALPPGAAAPAPKVDNTLADYEFVTDEVQPEAAMTSLVKSLDLGLQRGLSSRSLYDQIVLKFPAQIQAILKLSSVSQIHAVVAEKAPAHWSINSPRGKRAIEEMHALLTTGTTSAT